MTIMTIMTTTVIFLWGTCQAHYGLDKSLTKAAWAASETGCFWSYPAHRKEDNSQGNKVQILPNYRIIQQ